MNKIKIICAFLLIGLLALMIVIFFKVKNKEDYHQKVILAHEIRKALDHLMFDLREAREDTIQDVPADGRWHGRIAFEHTGQGALEYELKNEHLWRLNKGQAVLIADHIGGLFIRRQSQAPDILEVQIKAQNGVLLVSNFKVRIRH
ncbi:MAG: hypothetical protein HQL14_01275 [Candidatus Omnitrophica bacterium]|nr:hypothetical protein [Candidatus Omnitrophota bacterium]